MSYRYREVTVDNDLGTAIHIPSGRLVAFKAEGGTMTFNNRGNNFAVGDRLEVAEEFVAGECFFFGAPGSRARVYFRF